MTIHDDCLSALEAHERGDWDLAHNLAQRHEGHPVADWIHAMLHRDEGDLGNASYWYRRAGKPDSNLSVIEERDQIRSAIQRDLSG